MSFIEGEITVEFGGTVGPAGPAGNAVPIAANTVLANPTGSLANPVGVDAAGMRTLLSSVGYVSQTLTEGEQTQAKANLGLATVATSASATDLTAGTLSSARLPASAVTTAGSYSNPTWITSIDISKVTGTSTSPALCIISVGESNSGGFAPNASAFAWELASRPELQILNTSTLLFQNLDIGTNNNLNHLGLTPETHGWELELANAAKRDEFDRDVYYVQTGQGGSQAIEWSTTGGGNYFNTSFLPRVNAVKAIFGLRPVQYVVWLSLGINDAIAATDSYLFKGRVRSLIAQIKEQLPDVKICVGRIMRTNASYQAIDDRIAELSDDTSVRVVSISGLTTVDANHWDYQGMRRFSERLLDAAREMVPIPKRALTFTSSAGTVDGSLITFSGINQFANAIETIDFSYDQSIEIDWLGNMYGLIVALDTDINEVNWGGTPDPFLLGVFENAAFYITETNGAAAGNFASAGVSRLRFRKSGNDLLLESTTDMSTWTTRYTRSGVLSGVGNVRLKMKTAIGTAFVRVNAIATKIFNPSSAVTIAPHTHLASEITSGRFEKDRQNLQTVYLDATTQVFVDKLSVQSSGNATLSLSTVYGAGATVIQFLATGSTAQNAQLSSGVSSASNFVFYTGGASLVERVRIDDAGIQVNSGTLRIPHGSAPASPVNGDIWTTSAGLFVRINGSTVGPLS